MKATKFLSKALLIFSLIGLSSCNKKPTDAPRYCPTVNSTTTPDPTPDPTPTKTVEALNKELFENYAFTRINEDGSLALLDFHDNIPEEYLNLETIIIPEKIGNYTLVELGGCEKGTFNKFSKVKVVKIPSTIKTINNTEPDSNVFKTLVNLEKIEVAGDNDIFEVPTNDKGESTNCLYNKKDNEIVHGWKNVEIPKSVTEITNMCFQNNPSITSIKLHANVDTLSEFLYMDNLENVDLNGNTKFTIEDGTNLLHNGNQIFAAWGDVKIPESIYAGSGINFSGFSSITSIEIPDNFIFYSASDFKNLPKLTNIVYNGSYPYINGNCIYDDSGEIYVAWGEVTIPDSIYEPILDGFESVTSVKLNKNVSSLGTSAFTNLPNLSSIELNENETYKVLSDEKGGCLYEPNNDSGIYAAWGEVTIPSTIASPLLDGFASVKKVTLHEDVTNLPDNAFRGTKITSLDIPASVTSISQSAFNGLTDITDITISEENQYFDIINGFIFQYDRFVYAWGDAIFPSGKTNISDLSFENCHSLKSLTFDNNLSFENNLFFDDNIPAVNFKTLNFKGSVTDFKSNSVIDGAKTTLYELFKSYTAITVNFLKEDEQGNWSIDKSYKMMSELADIN